MKIKIVGFKVGKSRPITNRTATVPKRQPVPPYDRPREVAALAIGYQIIEACDLGSDFISIRRVDE